jgi:SAM-dependent methyltransferase
MDLPTSGWGGKIRCPECRIGRLSLTSQTVVCDCGGTFPVIDGRPVLLRHDNELFSADRYHFDDHKPSRAAMLARVLPSPSVNLSAIRVIGELARALDARGPCDVLVVGGGTQREWLDPLVLKAVSHRICYVDVDPRADVQIFCDAHELPFIDQSFDAIITTAVLEHVMYPEKVAFEMARVIRPAGFIYSELPFMQQVHGGAYDFTRYTMSGHRRLLNAFSELESGIVAGPGTALVWAIEGFWAALVPSSLRLLARAGVRILFGWLKYSDFLLKNRLEATGGASCTYFFGRRYENSQRTSDAEIVIRYAGGSRK